MINLNELQKIGNQLNRPECVLSHRSGLLFCSDWSGSGGVSIIDPIGNVKRILSKESDFIVRPNGIAIENSGSFLMAHLGEEDGGIFRLHPDGNLEAILLEIEGQKLAPSNYVHIDQLNRVWLTISTQHVPRSDAYRSDINDGVIILIDESGPKIVAENLSYTNECLVHPDGNRLFVNETFGRRLTSFDIAKNGNLSNRKTICEFAEGTYPDGMTFDEKGGIWITSIISNRVIRVLEDGSQTILLEDMNLEHIKNVENAYLNHTLDKSHLNQVRSQKLNNISSLAFGGPNLDIAYLGCLSGDHIAYFTSSVKGIAPNHWEAPLDKLLAVVSLKIN